MIIIMFNQNNYSGKTNSDSSLDEIVQQLRNKHNCTVEISVDSGNNLIGLFIQDSIMHNIFEAFPEVKIIYSHLYTIQRL